MKIDYLFSKRNKFGSLLISWASKFEGLSLLYIPSHIAVLIDETIVIESTFFTGIRIIPYSHWQVKNIELYKIPCENKYRRSKDILSKAYSLWGKGYDWLGIMFFGVSFIKLILFGDKLPNENKWQNKNRYFCSEFVAMLVDKDFSMCTPAKICDSLIKEGLNG